MLHHRFHAFRRFAIGLAALGGGIAAPALAQDDFDGARPSPEDSILFRDNISVGVGAILMPSYEGSDDHVLTAFPIVRGRLGGVDINPRQGGIALDLLTDKRGQKVDFSAGPLVGIKLNRARRIKDPVVRAAGKLDMAVEVGASGGVRINRLLHRYDSLSFAADVKWDVAGAYSGMVWRPQVSYVTPLSPALLIAVQASARHVDDDYARYYYSVTPGQSSASGLPQFDAKGGWDKVNFGTIVTWDLSGDVRDGGFATFVLANYSRMLNDGADTPYTDLRGKATQLMGGVGIAYTF